MKAKDATYVREMVIILSADNGALNNLKPVEEWPPETLVNYAKLEEQAKRFTVEEMEIMCNGELREQQVLTIKHSAEALNNFLESVFDGELNPLFYND